MTPRAQCGTTARAAAPAFVDATRLRAAPSASPEVAPKARAIAASQARDRVSAEPADQQAHARKDHRPRFVVAQQQGPKAGGDDQDRTEEGRRNAPQQVLATVLSKHFRHETEENGAGGNEGEALVPGRRRERGGCCDERKDSAGEPRVANPGRFGPPADDDGRQTQHDDDARDRRRRHESVAVAHVKVHSPAVPVGALGGARAFLVDKGGDYSCGAQRHGRAKGSHERRRLGREGDRRTRRRCAAFPLPGNGRRAVSRDSSLLGAFSRGIGARRHSRFVGIARIAHTSNSCTLRRATWNRAPGGRNRAPGGALASRPGR